MKKRYRINQPFSDKITIAVITLLLVAVVIILLYPLYFILIASFSDPVYTNAGQVWLTVKGGSLRAYEFVFRDTRIWTGYCNSLMYSFGFMALSVVLTVLAAYPLSNHKLVGRRVFNALCIIPMYFSGGLIPTFIVVRNLGLVNNPLIIVLLGSLSSFNIIIARTFFETSIPNKLLESAAIDGCNQARTFWSIVLPLSKPILAVIALYSFVGQWNSYFNAMVYLNKQQHYPLQLFLRQILLQSQTLSDSTATAGSLTATVAQAEMQKLADTIKYAVILVSTLPLLCVFPYFQRYFAQGTMVGAIKG